jgi:hypothetical protein
MEVAIDMGDTGFKGSRSRFQRDILCLRPGNIRSPRYLTLWAHPLLDEIAQQQRTRFSLIIRVDSLRLGPK